VKFSKEVKVGFLVTAALAALLWGMNYLKGIDIFTGDNKYFAIYNQVDGLVPSSDVILNGVKIGQVSKIEFLQDKSGRILATMLIKRKVFVGKNSVASIISSDLLGGRAIDIKLDSLSPPAQDGDTLLSDIQSSLSEQVGPIKDKAERLIMSLDSLAVSLNQVFNPVTRKNLDNSVVNLDKSLKSIENASRSLDNMISSENGKLRKMIANVESITNNIKNNNEELSNVIRNFSQISDTLVKADLAAVISNTNKTLQQTSSIMEKINRGEGSLGLLINDDSLYNALQRGAEDLDRLLIDLKQNPRRYVHFSVFGGGKGKTPNTQNK